MTVSSWTWTTTGSGASGNWGTGNNWTNGTISAQPGTGDEAYITGAGAGAYTIKIGASNPTVDVITLNAANATLTFNSLLGGTLSATTQAGSGLVLQNGSVAFSSPNGGTLNVNTLTATGGGISFSNTPTTTQTDVLNIANTLSLGASQITASTIGQVNIGTSTGSAGQVTIATGGLATIYGGSLTAQTFNIGGGTFTQSAGGVNITGKASFSGGTETFSGTALFQAGTVSIGNALTINGGTVQSNSGGGGITISSGTVLTMGGGTLDGTSGGIADSGTIIGMGAVLGSVTLGNVTASGGILDIKNNIAASSGLNFNIATGTSSVLELEGTEASGQTITFASASSGVLELNGATAVSGLSDTITNLGTDSSATSVSGVDFINLQGVTVDHINIGGVLTNEFNGSATTVTLYNASNVSLGTLNLASAPTAGTFFDVAADSTANGNALGGTDLFLSNVVCYAAGTAIMTEDGEVPVESLAEGDMIVTLRDGQAVPMPVKWMGVRKIDIAGHPNPHMVAPIRIRAGAFGEDQPRRDLLVSPAHAIYVDGKLVPANLLINHMTITQELHTKSVTYCHIELNRHSLILAEGLTSESYLDTGNRAYFSNAGLAMVLHPEFHVNAGLKQWEEDACAPLAIDAETIAPIWQTLADRAESLGFVPPRFTTTQDADLYLEANGRRLRPVAVANGRHTFVLPAGTGDIVLRSRTSAPADLDPLSGDWRPLGVAVRGMTLRNGDDHIVIPADHPGLTQGWHTAEAGNGDLWRWTAGNATIPMQGNASPAMLDIDIGAMGTYILARSDREQRLVA